MAPDDCPNCGVLDTWRSLVDLNGKSECVALFVPSAPLAALLPEAPDLTYDRRPTVDGPGRTLPSDIAGFPYAMPAAFPRMPRDWAATVSTRLAFAR